MLHLDVVARSLFTGCAQVPTLHLRNNSAKVKFAFISTTGANDDHEATNGGK